MKNLERHKRKEHERNLNFLLELSALMCVVIILLGFLYVSDAVRHRWTLLMILFLGALLHLCLFVRWTLTDKHLPAVVALFVAIGLGAIGLLLII